MATSATALKTTEYLQINIGKNPLILQSMRDSIRVVLSAVKPAVDNPVFHLIEARHPPLTLVSLDTNVWAMLTSDTAKLVVTELTEVPVIQEEHKNIHDGIGYTYADLITVGQAGSASNVRDILISVPAAVVPHLREIQITSDAASALGQLYEVTSATAGTPLTPRNNNRNFPDVAGITLTIDPTAVVLGTRLEPILLTGTRQSGMFGERGKNEWNLAPNSLYLIRITNSTTGAASNQFVINMFWYEE